MRDRTLISTTVVGAFVLSAIVLLVVGSLWIAGSAWFGGEDRLYTIRLRSTSGIEVGDRIRIAGVSSGRVREIRLDHSDEQPVRMVISLRSGVELADDARAIVASDGLLGTKFLQIDPGTPGRPPFPKDGLLDAESSMDMDGAMARVGELTDATIALLEKATTMLDDVSRQLDPVFTGAAGLLSAENASNVQQTLEALRITMEESGPRISGVTERLDRIAADLEEGIDMVPALIERVDTLVADVHGALGPDGARVARVLDSAADSLDSAGGALGTLEANQGEIDATLRDLRDTIANLKSFSQQVKERPYSLVRVKHPDDRRPGDGADRGGR